MRNGSWRGNTFLIQVSMLNSTEKELLITLLKNKLGLESYLTMSSKKLAISNPELIAQKLKPLFHSSQLHRLVKR